MQSTSWLTTDFALSLFGRELTQTREAYRRFVLAGIGMSPDNSVQMHWRARDRHSIDELIEHLCHRHEIDPADLNRPGRQRKLAQLRVLIIHHALDRRIATLSELARRFGRSASTVCESLEHYRRVPRTVRRTA